MRIRPGIWISVGLIAAVVAVAIYGVPGCAARMLPASGSPPSPPPAGPRDVTLFVAADAHYGASMPNGSLSIDQLNQRQIDAMNTLSGRAWPGGAGKVAPPRAVLMLGDMTDNGAPWQWNAFVRDYGRTGAEGLLKYPVYLCSGNHDRYTVFYWPVLQGIAQRHGSLIYAWDCSGVRMICLDRNPTAESCRWLAAELAAVGAARPVIIYFHYGLSGPYSGEEWWKQSDKDCFAAAVAGYNVIGVFHGHYHGSEHYVWRGLDVYNVGSPRHRTHSFAAVRVTDTTMTVASWDWSRQGWAWAYSKNISRP
ncbi:MAG: metallophosphoesterase [Planctomycetaceae bacterium]|nr:metallophosphoesterase [Planctomycetaceae bacterium]